MKQHVAIVKKSFVGLALALSVSTALHAEEKPIPRVIAALYDSRIEPSPRVSTVHNYLALPANHLGYDLNFYDVMSPLPALDDNVAAVVLWFNAGDEVPDVHAYVEWLKNVMKQGKKIIMIENPGLDATHLKDVKTLQMWNDVLGYVGVQDDTSWTQLTYDAEVAYIDHGMVGFERQIKQPFPEISGFHVLAGSHSTSHLRMHIGGGQSDDNFDMVVTGPHGGFVAQDYAIFESAKMVKVHVKGEQDKQDHEVEKEQVTQEWIINPFTFLKAALGDRQFPVPDTTTLDGRRIFYAHIDGDGWNNISEIERYHAENVLSSDVIYREVLKPYIDFAFSVGLISEDVDPNCFALPDSEKVARESFALPNVEPSSHTYSHPIWWDFFKNYTPDKEKPLLKYYPPKPEVKFSAVQMVKRKILGTDLWSDDSGPAPQKDDTNKPKQADNVSMRHKRSKSDEEILKEVNYMPRSYSCTPFKLEEEIKTSIDIVKKLSPPDKLVRLIQWPGDTTPFEAALKMTRENGFLNLNGGDSRFDGEYPSYSFVAPIGIKVGNERQIFSSNSNEETYTDDWTDRFYGYVYLKNTVLKTDKPIRVSPFNVYFHMFSGEKDASLGAVKDNLEFARGQDIIPITASDYASIAEGFFKSEIIPAGENTWRVRNRGDLSTVRFDNAQNMSVNFGQSRGVMGQYLFNDSLYVALDPAMKEATVSIYKGRPASSGTPELAQSRWQIRDMERGSGSVEFEAYGYGNSDMAWQVPPNTAYRVSTSQKGGKSTTTTVRSTSKGLLVVDVKSPIVAMPMHFSIRRDSDLLPERLNVSAAARKIPEAPEETPKTEEAAQQQLDEQAAASLKHELKLEEEQAMPPVKQEQAPAEQASTPAQDLQLEDVTVEKPETKQPERLQAAPLNEPEAKPEQEEQEPVEDQPAAPVKQEN